MSLDDVGRAQAEAVAARLGHHLDALVSSPMDRCQQTIAPLAAATGLPVRIEPALAEVDYGDWTGRALKDLGGEDLWRTVQAHPSAAVFPAARVLPRSASGPSRPSAGLVREFGPDAVILSARTVT